MEGWTGEEGREGERWSPNLPSGHHVGCVSESHKVPSSLSPAGGEAETSTCPSIPALPVYHFGHHCHGHTLDIATWSCDPEISLRQVLLWLLP